MSVPAKSGRLATMHYAQKIGYYAILLCSKNHVIMLMCKVIMLMCKVIVLMCWLTRLLMCVQCHYAHVHWYY